MYFCPVNVTMPPPVVSGCVSAPRPPCCKLLQPCWVMVIVMEIDIAGHFK